MKKIFSVVCLFLFVTVMGQSQGSVCKLNGHLDNSSGEALEIFRFDRSFEISIPVDAAGNFSSSFTVPDGSYYFIKQGKASSNIYLRNGYDLNVNIDSKAFGKSMVFKGEGALFNQYLKERADLHSKIVGDAKTFFVVPADSLLLKIEHLTANLKKQLDATALNQEDRLVAQKLNHYTGLLIRNNYQKFYLFHTKTDAQIPEHYLDPVKAMDMSDALAYNNSMDYRYLIVDKWRILEKEAQQKTPNYSIINFTAAFADTIRYEPIRDQIVRMLFNQVDTRNANYELNYQKIKPLVRVEKSKLELEKRLSTAKSNASGMALASFDYENHKGGKTSLASLKGKYVYIDIWATWCGPCVREFPELTQLIADYKTNPNIEFVCISIDSKEDYAKWRSFVTEKKVGGHQLIADKGLDADFMKFLNVSLIPRNVLIDPQGNIISSAGLRPSEKKTRETLAKYVGAPVVKLGGK